MEKKNITIHLPVDLIERARNVVYWSPGITMSALVEKALVDHLNSYDAFEDRPNKLKAGRPAN